MRCCRVLVLLVGLLSVGPKATAQCTSSIDLGPDTSLCAGAALPLSVPTGFLSYQWSTGATGNAITVAGAGTYSCTVTEFLGSVSSIVNGNFNAGATGFTSDYVPGSGGSFGLLSLSGTYATSTSPNLVHNNFNAFGDHTTGTGNMLVVNGAQVIGQNIWCQTVNVLPNTDYAFSSWLASALSASPAQLQYTVNGVPIGNLNASPVVGLWTNFYSLWNSGPATTAVLCITNLNTQQSGNDFAMDDIAFSQFCSYTDSITVTYFPFPTPDLGPPVSYCADTAIVLDPQWPTADNYAWQDGSSSQTLTPSASGIYWVDVTESGCSKRDSIAVTELPLPVANIGADGQWCDGDGVLLSAVYPGATYTWQDGSTQSTYTVAGSGTYWVTLNQAGCLDSDTAVHVYFPLPIIDLGNDTSICAIDDLLLDAFRPGGSYQWEDGTTAPQHQTSGAGVYWVNVEENACFSRDSLVLTTIPSPFVDLGPDRLLCAGSSELLDAEGSDQTYVWSDGSTGSSLLVDGPELYWVIATNSCAVDVDSVDINWDYCDCPVFAPNAFTANDDGINEGFLPQFACPNSSYLLRVFDRWGAMQWESSDPTKPWDGGGLPIGIYAWTVEFEPDSDVVKGKRKAQGHLMLLR